MKTFTDYARHYLPTHSSKITLYTHAVGIPLILLSVMIFLGWFKLIVPTLFSTTLATIGTLILVIYYLKIQWQLALISLPVLILLLWISSLTSNIGPTHFSVWFCIITALCGWSLLLISHFLDKKRPTFLSDYTLIFIAPLLLTAQLTFAMGHLQTLKQHIDAIDPNV